MRLAFDAGFEPKSGSHPYPHTDITNLSRISHTFITEQGIAPEMVGVDGVGLGAGVVDNLWHDGFQVTEVIAGAKPVEYMDDGTNRQYKNLRAQMWCLASRT